MRRKNLVVTLVLVVIFISMNGVLAFSVELTEYYDINESWTKVPLERAVENGLIMGESGRIRGEENLTRAEMATIINRAFNVENRAYIGEFTDITTDEWYYEEMQRAVHMKSFQGYEKKLNPKNNISREEAFVVLDRCFKLDGNYEENLSSFSDREKISDWAKDSLIGLVSNGYIAGNKGELKPDKNITRAEFAKLMDNLISNYIVEEGEYSQDFNGNLMINKAGVILKDSTIRGDLIIGDGVGSGDIILDHITVEGRLLARGGGENSIIIRGDSKIDNILTGKIEGKMRIKTESTNIKNIVLDCEDDIILEGDFDNLLIKGNDIQIYAENSNVHMIIVEGKNIKLNFGSNSKVNRMELDKKSENIEVRMDKTVEIEDLKINSEGTIISGEGKINNLENNSKNLKSYLSSKELVKKDRDKSSKKDLNKSEEKKEEVKPVEPAEPDDKVEADKEEIENPEEPEGETIEPDEPDKPVNPDEMGDNDETGNTEIPGDSEEDEVNKPLDPVDPSKPGDKDKEDEIEDPDETEDKPIEPDDSDKPSNPDETGDNDETGNAEIPGDSEEDEVNKPLDPDEPEEPVDPSKPGDNDKEEIENPEEPEGETIEPDEPEEPADPSKPGDNDETGNTEIPGDSEEDEVNKPLDPDEPEEPVDPSKPDDNYEEENENPEEPEGETIEPDEPEEPADPSKPGDNDETGNTEIPGDSEEDEVNKPLDPDEPEEPVDPSKPDDNYEEENEKPGGNKEEIENPEEPEGETIEPDDPDKPVNPDEMGDNDETGNTEIPGDSEEDEVNKPLDPVEPEEPVDPSKPGDNDKEDEIEDPDETEDKPIEPDDSDKPSNPDETGDNYEEENEKPGGNKEEIENPEEPEGETIEPDEPEEPADPSKPGDNDETQEMENPTIKGSIGATEMKSGDKLSSSKLSGTFIDGKGDVIPGELNWVDREKTVDESGDYEWSFIPINTENYNSIQGTVRVEVIPVVLVSNQDELANAIKDGRKYIRFESNIVASEWKESISLYYNVKGGEIDLGGYNLSLLERTLCIKGEDVLIKNGKIETSKSYPISFNGKNTIMDNIKFKGSVYLLGRWKDEEISGFNEYSLTIKNCNIRPNDKEKYNIIKIDGNGNGSVIVQGGTLSTKNRYAFHIEKEKGNSIVLEDDVKLILAGDAKIYDKNYSKEPIIKSKVDR